MSQENVIMEAEYAAEEIILTNKSKKKYNINKNDTEQNPYVIIILFYFLGTIGFIPHNFFVTANEYWMYKFRDPNLAINTTEHVTKTVLQKNFTANVGICGNIGLIAFCVLTLIFHKRVSLHKRIVGSMYALLLIFFIILLFVYVDTDSWQTQFFVIALLVGFLINAWAGILLISVYQLAARFPARCLAAQMAGQSICGLLASLCQIIALAAVPSVSGTAAFFYAMAIGIIATIITCYFMVLKRSEEFRCKVYMEPEEEVTEINDRPKFELDKVKKVFKKMWLLLLASVCNVGVTGLLQPGLTSLVESSSKGGNAWGDTYFVPVVVFFLFNGSEFISREVSNHIPKLKNVYIIAGTSLPRLCLIPLILLCNIQPRNNLPVVFQDDAYFIIFVIILSLTGGYLSNVTILMIPKCCDPDEIKIGTMMIIVVLLSVLPLFTIFSSVLVNVI